MASLTTDTTAKQTYDYIITGAGCAGLSLLMHLIADGRVSNKRILVLDKDAKQRNDRTWCFWETGEGLFQPIVKKQWKHLWFQAHGLSKKLALEPYQYKLIRGIDFYNFCLERIALHPNITFINVKVEALFSNATAGTGVTAGGETYYAQYIFNSILFQKPILTGKQYWLLQHFKGWLLETPTPQFDEQVGTLMDFRTDQKQGTTFFYVLPFSPTQALVEYTLFSNTLLPQEAYEAALKTYVAEQLQLTTYEIKETEFGVIPMSNYEFPSQENNIIHMGTAGGQTKASSGYTFRFIQKHAQEIVRQLKQQHPTFSKPHGYRRFRFYDSILLHILHHQTLDGAAIFTDLFAKNTPQLVFKFLDNETSLTEELQLIATLPTLPFLKAAIKQFTPLGAQH